MRLARFRVQDRTCVGVVRDDELIELPAHDAADPIGWLALGRKRLERAAAAPDRPRHPLAGVELLAPVRPSKFLAIGLNYADHVAEAGLESPAVPTVFNKQVSCITGTGAPIERPRASDKLDYEGELGFVIGRRCRHVPAARAHEVIAGYLIVNDVSVRDWQAATPTITMGKSWDSHGPMGPWLTTADAVEDPHALSIRTWVNDQLRQSSNTRHLIFNCFDQVAHLSTVCTLEPGDVVATGTPSGVGVLMTPPKFLAPGDVVRIEIDGLGVLENPVVDEPDDDPRIEALEAAGCAG
jgi:2-keto-4-pentenoate hydratase/2-oxohepta-3-ene-1,7-dioic acid hydratase in catechol pathway